MEHSALTTEKRRSLNSPIPGYTSRDTKGHMERMQVLISISEFELRHRIDHEEKILLTSWVKVLPTSAAQFEM